MTAAIAYETHEKLIQKTAWTFAQRYGTEFDETFSEAAFKFLESFGNVPAGSGSGWVWNDIWYHLLHWIRDERKAARRPEKVEEEDEGRGAFFLPDLLDSLSASGREVVELALETPEEVLQAALESGNRPRNVSKALKYHLHEQGWTWDQIWKTWDEVREAL